MNFGLTEEQELLQETVRSFVANECPPPRLRELFDAGQGSDPALWQGMVEMGLAGLMVPEVHGGAGMELLELALVAEALGGGVLPSPFLGHSLAALALVLGGSDAQKSRWLPRLATGNAIGTYAVAEADSQWEPSEWRVQEHDGKINGTKLYVPHAERADLIVVGCAGGGLALVEREAEGVSLENMQGIDRTRPMSPLKTPNS